MSGGVRGTEKHPTIPEYEEALKAHDWHYQYSDDNRVFQAGMRAHKMLSDIAWRLGGRYQELYIEYIKKAEDGQSK